MVGRVQQRPPQGRAFGAGVVAHIGRPGENIVLQPQHHHPVGHRRHQEVHPVGRVRGQPGLQGAAGQLGRHDHPAAGERVQRDRPLVGLDPQQEVAREVDAGDLELAAPRRLQIDHAQRHRQALAPFAHRDDVGVGRVVVGQQVPIQPQVAAQRLADGVLRPLVLEPLGQELGRLGGEGSRRLGLPGRVFVQGAGERRLEQREPVVRRRSRRRQGAFRLVLSHRRGRAPNV